MKQLIKKEIITRTYANGKEEYLAKVTFSENEAEHVRYVGIDTMLLKTGLSYGYVLTPLTVSAHNFFCIADAKKALNDLVYRELGKILIGQTTVIYK